jgi:hypothetical protein
MPIDRAIMGPQAWYEYPVYRIETVKFWFETKPRAKSDLTMRREDLADQLEGIEYSDRCEILEELQRTDPELYQSWVQHPFSWED